MNLQLSQARIKIARRNINNLWYTDDTILMAESEEKLKSFLMRIKEESENASTKLNMKKKKKTNIMASSPITSWQREGGKVETETDFISLSFKISVDRIYSHRIKRHFFLGRKAMTNLDNILKSRYITLLTKVHVVKAVVFPVVMYRCWELNHKGGWAPNNWCFWIVMLRVSWTARRSNKSILKEINLEYSLKGLMLKLKFQ